jgi:signal transduction histidine kinase
VLLSFDTDAPSLTQMSGDPSLMFEAISNLVDNAIKFSPAGGCVGVRTYCYKGRIGVAVSDNGPGIPHHEREAVLRRFHRLEKSRHTPGSGLGLSLVAAVAKLHGLSLTIDSSYPGSCVTLERDQPALVPGGTAGGGASGDAERLEKAERSGQIEPVERPGRATAALSSSEI